MQNHLIIDVGMHVGKDSEFYLKKGFCVVGIEANPFLVKEAKSRLKKYLSSGQMRIIETAIAEQKGEIDFYINLQHKDWSTTSKEVAMRSKKLGTNSITIKTKCLPFESILQETGIPYYLKVDIEGNEMLCLKALGNFKEKPKYVSIEMASLGALRNNPEEIFLLWDLEYRGFKIINQALNYKLQCPSPPREGKLINYPFDGYCSGLFGEESPGKWMSLRKTILLYKFLLMEKKYQESINKYHKLAMRIIYKKIKRSPTGWYDLHARYAPEE